MCIATAAAANSTLLKYTKTLPVEDINRVKERTVELLRGQEKTVVEIEDFVVSDDSIAVKSDVQIVTSGAVFAITIYVEKILETRDSTGKAYSPGGASDDKPGDKQEFIADLAPLFLKSIYLALEDFSGLMPRSSELETIRYADNGSKKVERGKMIRKTCTDLVFESLRGEIKSVPILRKFRDGRCAPRQSSLDRCFQTTHSRCGYTGDLLWARVPEPQDW